LDLKGEFRQTLRPTIGPSITVAATDTQATQALRQMRLYQIENRGPDSVYVRMFPNDGLANVVSTADQVLRNGETTMVQVGVLGNRTVVDGPSVLYVICAAGETASVVVTQVSRV